jgi:hypothetical protein
MPAIFFEISGGSERRAKFPVLPDQRTEKASIYFAEPAPCFSSDTAGVVRMAVAGGFTAASRGNLATPLVPAEEKSKAISYLYSRCYHVKAVFKEVAQRPYHFGFGPGRGRLETN